MARPVRLYRNKSTGVADPLLWRIASTHKHLTLYRNFTVGFSGTWDMSPFAEFTCTPAPLGEEVKLTPRQKCTVQDAVRILLPIVRQYIADTWQPDKFHFIFHSSGYDSRVISGCIKSLYQECGPRWLGDVVFATNKWEAKPFKQIMEAQGWNVSQQYIHNEDMLEGVYFNHSLNIDRAYQELNAPCPIPSNLWWYIPVGYTALHPNIDLQSMQSYSGYWANETHETFLQSDREWYTRCGYWYSYNVMASLPMAIPDTHFVFSHLLYQQALAGLQVTTTSDAKELRKALADLASPEASHIPNLGLSDRHHLISEPSRANVLEQYRRAWYNQHVQSTFWCPTSSEFSPQWGDWSMASLCEYLIKNGVTIDVV